MDNFAAQLSLTLQQMYNRISTCEAGLLSPVDIDRGLNLLKKLGYPTPLLDILPPESYERAFPLANPLSKIIEINPKTILDLGCGSALDGFFCLHSLPELKYILGVDASSGLLDEARKRLINFPGPAAKMTLLEADLNQLERHNPGSFDMILMNGSFNLIYDKTSFFQTISRFLNNHGKILIYDFLLIEDLPPGFVDEIDNWLWNIGGALREDELRGVLNDVELKLISVEELERIDPVVSCEILIAKKTACP